MSAVIMSTRLRGKELLEFVRNQDPAIGRDTVIKQAGYVAIQAGKECLRRTEFYEELLLAQGNGLDAAVNTKRRTPSDGTPGGRRLNNVVRVNGRNGLFLAAGYCRQLGVEPGDNVEIFFDAGQEGDQPALVLTKVVRPTPVEEPKAAPWAMPELQQQGACPVAV